MCLDMFLKILWSLKGLATELALVRLERNMNSDVRGDVVALDGCCSALTPCACQVEVVGRFSTDVSFTYVLLLSKVSYQKIEEEGDVDLRIEPLVFGIARRILAIDIVNFRLRR